MPIGAIESEMKTGSNIARGVQGILLLASGILAALLSLPVAAQTACLIVPYSTAALTKLHDPATIDKMPRLVLFGSPAIERAGVTGRRMAFCHPWDRDDSRAVSTWTWIKAKLTALNVSYTVRLTGTLPADWRYPVVTP